MYISNYTPSGSCGLESFDLGFYLDFGATFQTRQQGQLHIGEYHFTFTTDTFIPGTGEIDPPAPGAGWLEMRSLEGVYFDTIAYFPCCAPPPADCAVTTSEVCGINTDELGYNITLGGDTCLRFAFDFVFTKQVGRSYRLGFNVHAQRTAPPP